MCLAVRGHCSHFALPFHPCFSFLLLHSKEKGEKDLALRQAIAAGKNPSNIPESTRSHDPFPVPRSDGTFADPLIEVADSKKPVMEIAGTKDDPITTTFVESQPVRSTPSLSESSSRSVTPESVDSQRTSSPEVSGHISSISSRGDGGYYSNSGSLKGSVVSPPSLSESPFSNNSDYSPQSDQVFYSPVETERLSLPHPSMSSSLIKMEGYASLSQTHEPQTLTSLLHLHPSPPKHPSPTPLESPHFTRPHIPNVATSFMQAQYNSDYPFGYDDNHTRAQPYIKQEMPDFGQLPANAPSFQLPANTPSFQLPANPRSFQLPQSYGTHPLHAQGMNMVFSGSNLHKLFQC